MTTARMETTGRQHDDPRTFPELPPGVLSPLSPAHSSSFSLYSAHGRTLGQGPSPLFSINLGSHPQL